jgi:hypothetical protein
VAHKPKVTSASVDGDFTVKGVFHHNINFRVKCLNKCGVATPVLVCTVEYFWFNLLLEGGTLLLKMIQYSKQSTLFSMIFTTGNRFFVQTYHQEKNTVWHGSV